MKKSIILFLVISMCLCACNNQQQTLQEKQAAVENGKIDETYTYEAKKLGWKTSLPKDWEVLTKQETDKANAKGKEAIEKSVGVSVDMSTIKELVNLKKDMFNSFQSTMEPFDEAQDGSYDEKNKVVTKLINDTYTSKGMKFDIKEGKEMVGGLDFNVTSIIIYKPGSSGEPLLKQKLYSRLQNGYDFAMTMNYNNPKDSATMQHIINDSKFGVDK